MLTLRPTCVPEESVEISYLRRSVSEYDELMQICFRGEMDQEDVEALDRVYMELLNEEHRRWTAGAPISPLIIESTLDQFDSQGLDFPAIRFALGILPGQTNTRSYE